jgi:hypothetical protein
MEIDFGGLNLSSEIIVEIIGETGRLCSPLGPSSISINFFNGYDVYQFELLVQMSD